MLRGMTEEEYKELDAETREEEKNDIINSQAPRCAYIDEETGEFMLDGIDQDETEVEDTNRTEFKVTSSHQTEFVFYLQDNQSAKIERFYQGVIIFALLLVDIYLVAGIIYGCKKGKKQVSPFKSVANDSQVTQNDVTNDEIKIKPVNNFFDKEGDTAHTLHTEPGH